MSIATITTTTTHPSKIVVIKDKDAPLHPITEGTIKKYEDFTFICGYGELRGVYIELTQGVTIDLDINIEMTIVSEETFSKWRSEVKQYFTEQEWKEIEESSTKYGGKAGFLAKCFAIKIGGGRTEYLNNTTIENDREYNESQKRFLQSVYNLKMDKTQVTGKIKAIGNNDIPTKVSAFTLMATINFNDGRTIKAIDTESPVAATPEGDTVTTTVLEKINIVLR